MPRLHDEIPRGVDFLFSLNRINVAISRAQVLSLVFASPRLLEVPCANVAEMRLVNGLCALREYGDAIAEGDCVSERQFLASGVPLEKATTSSRLRRAPRLQVVPPSIVQ
jgi:hypothetical protein